MHPRARARGRRRRAAPRPAPRSLARPGVRPRPLLEARPYWIRLIIRFRVGRARGPPRRQKLHGSDTICNRHNSIYTTAHPIMRLWAFASSVGASTRQRAPPVRVGAVRSDGAVSGGAADAGRVGLVAAAWSTGTWAARAAASRAAACRAASCRGASWRRAGRCRRPPTATRACATSRRRRARARRTTPCGTTTSSRRPWTSSVSTALTIPTHFYPAVNEFAYRR